MGILDKVRIFTVGPFARFAYKRRQRARFNRRCPIQWRTPRQILFYDFEKYEPKDGDQELNSDSLKFFSEKYDAINEKIKSASFKAYLILAILIASYFSVDLHVSLFDIEVGKVLFYKECLLLLLVSINGYVAVMENNSYTIESAMLFIIEKNMSAPFKHLYKNSLLPSRSIISYFAQVSPYIIKLPAATNISYIPIAVSISVMLFFLIGVTLALAAIEYDLWQHPTVAYWTRAVVVISVLLEAATFIFYITNVVPLPYRNFEINKRFEELKKHNPSQYDAERSIEYKEDIEDEISMRTRGYIK